jgi:hypothetical protein
VNNLIFGIICGLAFGILDVLIMIPLKYENSRKKTEAMTAAFIERFMIGFLIPITGLNINPMITGIIIGLGLSIPSAIITRVYAPIIGIGAVGGFIIGLLTKVLL